MAGELHGDNVSTYQLDAATTAALNALYPGDPFDDVDGDGSYNTYLGCNRAGSNAPGIGINSGNLYPLGVGVGNQESWSLEDQFEAGRTPQDSEHIGGDGLGAGEEFPAGVNPINMIIDQDGTPDFNNTANFVVADTVAAPGVECDTVTGAVNRTAVTTAVGDILWADVPVA